MTDLEGLARAASRKAAESARVVESFVAANADGFARAADAVAQRLGAGGRLFTFGSGGSACDAQHLAVEFMHPILEKRPALPAISLAADSAMMSAISNDGDFALVFVDQLRVLARPGDILVGVSTSGDSAAVLRAVKHGKQNEMLTIGLSGRDGGRLAKEVEHSFVVPSYSIHRIQEAHGVALHLLWDLSQVAMGAEDVL